MRPCYVWQIGSRSLRLGERTLVMGVLNVTPDSFSDGGLYLDRRAAVEHGLRMADEGADILDVGGESTRPGSTTPAVSAQEEIRRVLPVIRELRQRRPELVISIDTYKAETARVAAEAGAEIVNDISGFRWDAEMPKRLAELKCGAVLMHVRGRPADWRTLPPVDDMAALVARELSEWADAAIKAGVARERLVLDPGFGFGKNYEQNYPLLARFGEFHRLGFPLLAGVSRKSFIGRAMARAGVEPAAEQRLAGSLAAAVIAIMKGAHIVRAHDVKATVEAAAVADAIAAEGRGPRADGCDGSQP